MEKKYWIGRKRSAMEMARGALTSEARLIHYELAGRYSVMAAQCPAAQSDRAGARATLHLPDVAHAAPVPTSSADDREPAFRRNPRSPAEPR
jgi:hypothetical protein